MEFYSCELISGNDFIESEKPVVMTTRRLGNDGNNKLFTGPGSSVS